MVTENPYVVDQHVYEEIDEFRSADMYSENLKGSVPSAPPPPQQEQQEQQQQPVAEEPGGGRRSSKCGTKTSVFLVSVVFLSITVVILILAIRKRKSHCLNNKMTVFGGQWLTRLLFVSQFVRMRTTTDQEAP